MNSMLCSRCKKRLAVVFVSRMEGDKTYNEGLCLQCAKELGIKPVEDLMSKMGITDDQLDAMSEQLMNPEEMGEEGFEMGGAAPLPFLNSIFGGAAQEENAEGKNTSTDQKRAAQSRRKIKRRRKSS